MTWRFLAQALPSGEWVETDLPLSNVSITTTLSGPGSMSGTVPIEVGRLQGSDGEPILKEWGSAIWAEKDGQIRGGGIVDISGLSGSEWRLECVGFSGYLKNQPYVGNGRVWTRVDPADVIREAWSHAQSFPGGDLGVLVDPTATPIRVGEEQYVPIDESLEDFDTTFDDGPIRFNWWDTHDLGEVVDDMAERGGLDYLEQTTWAGTRLEHRLRLFYPKRGRRREDLRFVLGENVAQIPDISGVEEGFASHVMVLGAGEGREKLQTVMDAGRGRLRRVAIITDDSLKRRADVNERARAEARKRTGHRRVEFLTVFDHPNAPIGSWTEGDQIRIQGPTGWADLDMWLRVVGTTISPEDPGVATLDLVWVP